MAATKAKSEASRINIVKAQQARRAAWKGGTASAALRAQITKMAAARQAQPGGVCPITGQADGPTRVLVVDHKKGTKIVRGVVESRANTALGLLNECPGRIFRLGEYIARHLPGYLNVDTGSTWLDALNFSETLIMPVAFENDAIEATADGLTL